jgi:hypothetical protein
MAARHYATRRSQIGLRPASAPYATVSINYWHLTEGILLRKYTWMIMQIRRRDNPSSHQFVQMTIGARISVTGSADR